MLLCKKVVGQFSMLTPIFDCPIVKRMKVNRADSSCFLDCVDVIFSQQLKNILSNFPIVKISIHLRIFGLNQNTTKSSIRVSLSLMKFVEVDNHLDDIRKQGESKLVIENIKSSRSLSCCRSCLSLGLLRCSKRL